MTRTSLIARTGLALAALVVPMVLGGCGESTNPSAGNQSVTSISAMDVYKGDNYTTIVDTLNKCAANAGVTLDRQIAPAADYSTKVRQQMSSRTLPDLLLLANADIAPIAAAGALAPLSNFNVSTDGYAKGVHDAATYNGKVYGLPPTTNTVALYYNKDLFAKAGVAPPTTWDELKAAAAKLTTGSQYGIVFSAAADVAAWEFKPFMWTNGGDTNNIATPQTAEALQLWTDLVKSGSASSSVLTWQGQDEADQFIAGKAAMMINGSFWVQKLNTTPDLHYGVVKIPGKSASDVAVAPLGGFAWTVPQTGNKAKQAKAAEVVACMNSDEAQLTLAKVGGVFPTKTTVAAQFATEHPEYAVFTDLLETARLDSDARGDAAIGAAVQTALTGKASPLDALEQAQNNR